MPSLLLDAVRRRLTALDIKARLLHARGMGATTAVNAHHSVLGMSLAVRHGHFPQNLMLDRSTREAWEHGLL